MVSKSKEGSTTRDYFYYGEFEYPKGGELRMGTHEPLITKETFLAARRTIDEQTVNRTDWGSRKLPYRRVFICDLCANQMCVEENGKYTYVRCSGYTKDKGRCNNTSLTLELIDKQTITAVNSGHIKRSSFLPVFNQHVDDYYRVTKSIMAKQGVQYSSTTRLRDYIIHIFSQGTLEQREFVLKHLVQPPRARAGKLIFE